MSDPAVERLRLALEMADAGIALMRQNLRRRHPGESDAEIERRLGEWLRDGPGDVDPSGVLRRRTLP